MTKATIIERGNGFPGVDEYVAGDDGEVYRVVSVGSRIETSGPGGGNRIPGCEIELADWDDVTDDTEPYASAQLESYEAGDLVLCESPDGWSLHAPGSTDEQIANGDAPYLVSGEGQPTDADYEQALRLVGQA